MITLVTVCLGKNKKEKVMKNYNNVTIVGKVVRDAELKTVDKNGESVSRAHITLAIDRNNEKVTDFLNVVSFGKLAELIADYAKKFSVILITGRIQSRSYEIENETRWITEIVADSFNVLEYKGGK